MESFKWEQANGEKSPDVVEEPIAGPFWKIKDAKFPIQGDLVHPRLFKGLWVKISLT